MRQQPPSPDPRAPSPANVPSAGGYGATPATLSQRVAAAMASHTSAGTPYATPGEYRQNGPMNGPSSAEPSPRSARNEPSGRRPSASAMSGRNEPNGPTNPLGAASAWDDVVWFPSSRSANSANCGPNIAEHRPSPAGSHATAAADTDASPSSEPMSPNELEAIARRQQQNQQHRAATLQLQAARAPQSRPPSFVPGPYGIGRIVSSNPCACYSQGAMAAAAMHDGRERNDQNSGRNEPPEGDFVLEQARAT